MLKHKSSIRINVVMFNDAMFNDATARAGFGADVIQPGLAQLQPPLEDFMDLPLQGLCHVL